MEVETLLLKEEIADYMKRKRKYKVNMIKAYGLILGQCTKAIKNKLEARKDWETGIRNNAINLLKALKEITHNYQDNRYPIESIYHTLKAVFTIKQKEDESLAEFTKRFNNVKDVMETKHGQLWMQAYLSSIPGFNGLDDAGKHVEAKEEYDKLMALSYLKALDAKKCGKLLEDLNSMYALDINKFPKDIADATNTVINYKQQSEQSRL